MTIASSLRTLLATAVLVAMSTTAGLAQDPLTLDDAIALAVRQNPTLRGARAAEREAASRTRQAKSIWLPRVDITEAWQRGNQPVFVFGSLLAQRRFTQDDFRLDALNHPGALGSFRLAVTVEQVLFDGSRTRGAVRTAALAEDLAREGGRAAAAAVRVGVTEAYGHVLLARASRAAAEAGVQAAEEDVRRGERRRDAGLATEADVLAFQLHRADIRARLITATSQEFVARTQLNAALGEPLDRQFDLQPVAPAPADVPPIDALEQEALRNSPSALEAAVREQLAREAVTSARGAFLPQAAIQGGWEANGRSVTDRASSWSVAAVVRWNVFAGFADGARLGEARAALDRTKAERDRVDTQVRVGVRAAVARLDEARGREAVGRSARALAAESQRIVRDRYEAGLAGVADVLRAASAVIEAEVRHTAATVDVVVSAAMLERARGR